jgi:LuxR family maltose regulon positive regulatory protein
MTGTGAGGGGDLERVLDRPASPAGPPAEVSLRPPLQPSGTVRRTALLARIHRASADAPVLLEAPRGYGKTTLLAQWAASATAVAWVTAGADDDDPAHLALRIALALQTALPLGAEAVGLSSRLKGGRSLDPADVVRAFVALQRTGHPALLVLDDLDRIRDPASLALVRALITESAATMRVAVATRTRPDLALPTPVAARCLEFGPAELAFSHEETRRLFVAARQPGTPDLVRAVLDRTEGWPAGVYLAALVARQEPRGGARAVRPGVLAGNDVYVADYFRAEVLAREPGDNVRFLLRTSVLERMSGPVCDAVLGTTGSRARLLEAERRNLFVVRMDAEGRWYRYHRLFRETLLAELRLREPGEEERLHGRAAAWFEREGMPDQAITHALAGADTIRAARLVDLRARPAFAAGAHDTVQGWLRHLGEAALAAYPPLAVTAGWIWALSVQPTQAQSCLGAARAARFSGPLPDGSSSLEAAAALLGAFLAPSGVERMLDDARRAVELEPPGTPRRPLALAVLGAAHVLTGRPDLALPVLTEAAEIGAPQQRLAAALARAELAVTALEDASSIRVAGADADIAASVALIEEAGLQHDTGAMLTYAVAAWSAARAGDVSTVRRYVAAVQRIDAEASPASFPWFGAQVSIVLGRAVLEAGEPLAARERIEEARQYLGHLPTEGVLRDQVEELAELVRHTPNTAGLPSSMALTTAEVRVLQLLPSHLSLGEIAAELGVSRNTIKSQVGATYRKLQAATRDEAVRRGRELGLLEPGAGSPPPRMR